MTTAHKIDQNMNEEVCSSDTHIEIDLEAMDEKVITTGGVSLMGKCLICSTVADENVQCHSNGIENFLQQCQLLGRFDLCDYILHRIKCLRAT